MSEPLDIARVLLNETWNEGICEYLDEVFGPGCVCHTPSGAVPNGAKEQIELIGGHKRWFPAASKAAVDSLTKSAALEHGRNGIRVVGIAPGPIDTPMPRSAVGNERPPAILEKTSLGRLGEPEDVANATLWLASDSASYVSGATLPVDGGFLAP